jgi:phosphoglycolate phosphatase-like HAD superfamily hydrolase
MTTGYDRRMVNETSKKLPWLSDVLLASFTSNDVKKGRPAPYLIFHSMEAAGVENPAYAVKVGDTEVDMGAPDNAHMPGIIVLTGSLKEESTEKVDETLNRKHLVLPSLEDVVDYAINDELGGIIKELNKF